MRRNLVVLVLGVLIGAVVAGTSAFAIASKTPATRSTPVTTTTISPERAHRRAVRTSIAQLKATRRADRRALNTAVASLTSQVRDRHATIKAMIAALENADRADSATVRSDRIQQQGQARVLGARIRALIGTIAASHARSSAPNRTHRG
jgi:hypothetical protein